MPYPREVLYRVEDKVPENEWTGITNNTEEGHEEG